MANRGCTCVSRLWNRLGLVVIWRMGVLVRPAIWTEIHVVMRVVAGTMAMWYASRGVMEWTIIAGRAREDGTKFSDASEDVGRKRRGRILGTMRRLCMIIMMMGVMMFLRSDDILMVNRRAAPARRLAERKTFALFTFVTSTAARGRFTL